MKQLSSYGINKNGNLLVEGDNLDVLRYLQNEYSSAIDVITIDPPYNTQIDYIGYADSEFSTGWTDFISKRIEISKQLLKSRGVIFINIDENELCSLVDVCKKIFGNDNVNILVWPKIDPVFDENRVEKKIFNVKSSHEFIVLCYMDKKNTHFNKTSSGDYLESIVKGLGTTSSAKDEIKEILGDRSAFSTPKPMKLLKELIRVSSDNQATVLDFFAGSGTTGHAVMDLNNEDNGTRRFILVNNDENDICKDITYSRLVKTIEKYGYKEGFDFFSYS